MVCWVHPAVDRERKRKFHWKSLQNRNSPMRKCARRPLETWSPAVLAKKTGNKGRKLWLCTNEISERSELFLKVQNFYYSSTFDHSFYTLIIRYCSPMFKQRAAGTRWYWDMWLKRSSLKANFPVQIGQITNLLMLKGSTDCLSW